MPLFCLLRKAVSYIKPVLVKKYSIILKHEFAEFHSELV